MAGANPKFQTSVLLKSLQNRSLKLRFRAREAILYTCQPSHCRKCIKGQNRASKLRTIDSFVAAYARGMISCFLSDPSIVLDLIPADMVVNASMVTMAAQINQPYSKTIYHVGSSKTNPITISTLTNFISNYFANNPLISKHGKPVETANKFMFSSSSGFNRYVAVHYKIPLKRLENANMASSASYDLTNLNKLRNVKAEAETFFVDLKTLDWEEYFMNIHFPGLVKYSLGGLLRGSENGKWVSKY
ncbi:alcohol-forming fatty acyl-CoA reductase-like [Rutidosis leptorrhynchoides]|uniref:alcohol-forming fatty acyl-CoA reductase-like n=1 Tax=Rutidosis leptorrhynchoides TaxID=125765 RepID=UPI003A98DE70